MQKLLVVALVAALGVVAGNKAQAALIIGSQAFNASGITSNTGNVNSAGMFTFNLQTGVDAAGDYDTSFGGSPGDGIGASGLSVMGVSLNAASLSTFAFNITGFGSFAAISGIDQPIGTGSRSFTFTGNFTPAAGGNLAGFDVSESNLIITFNQAGGTNQVISASVTIQSPASIPTDLVTPEPTSIAMFGTMMLPLALGWYRRRSSAVAA